MSFVLRKEVWGGPWVTHQWPLVTRKTEPFLEVWNFQPCPPFFRERRGAGNWINNWSCLLRKPLYNLNSQGVEELPGWWKQAHWGEGECGWCTPTPQEQCSRTQNAPRPRPLVWWRDEDISSSGCSTVSFNISLNNLVNSSVSLSSVKSSRKLIGPEDGGVFGIPDLYLVGQKHKW